ncbi:MAG: hypothetical protein GF311_12600 [Candidatus Lokiarchaeota archaeon]|nr:hypothetical protein [Candidatus Lokiarchaeota archaeon]MBD3339908.1 hypothetical protein [Candidatus Lokiarchaeota archaeon]
MTKKIVAIIGSPRKGDTVKALQKFENVYNSFYEAEFEYLSLAKLQLKDCIGCHLCVTKGDEYCHQSEKVGTIIEKMLKADGIILATPIYSEHITYLMKKMVDYLSFLYHRPRLFGKQFLGIVVGGPVAKTCLKYLSKTTQAWGGTWVGGFGVPHYDSLTPKYKKSLDKDFETYAYQFYKALEKKPLIKPSIKRIMWFYIWKVNVVVCKEDGVKDFEYWKQKEWVNSFFYYPIKINPFKKAITKLMMNLGKKFMGKMFESYKNIEIPEINKESTIESK